LQTVKARGAHTVVVVGQPEDGPRLEVAKQLGADHVFTTQDGNVADRVAKVTDGRMASVVIEATGNPAAMPTVLNCAARQARVLVIGISHAEATFNPVIIVRRELQVMGSFCYSWEDFEESLWLLARGKITTRKMVTHVMALEQLGQALELLRERTALKVILRP
jgi:L-iditol 2-dehydrogenase